MSVTVVCGWAETAGSTTPSADDIVRRLQKADAERAASLAGYTQTRRYTLENKRFHTTGEILVRMSFAAPGKKDFEVVSESGSKLINNRVLRKMVQAEADAAEGASRRETKLTPDNYNFHFAGTGKYLDRPCYILDVTPKIRNKYLVEGKIWVDAADYAVVRIEGAPARNPSMWTRNIHIVHQYHKFGPFWLAVSNHSSADAMMFGRTDVDIEYYDIRINGESVSGERAAR